VGNIGRFGLWRVAYTVISIAGIMLLSHMGRLELAVAAAISLKAGRTRLMPLAPVIILSIDIPVVLTGTRSAIETVGIVAALPLPGLSVPAVSTAPGPLPLTVPAMPALGITAGLLPAMRLTTPAMRIGPGLGPMKSRMIPVPGKGTVRPGLGGQRDQCHKQGHRKNNAPPFFRSHVLILLIEYCIVNLRLMSRRLGATVDWCLPKVQKLYSKWPDNPGIAGGE
jgi:hypothetical protein